MPTTFRSDIVSGLVTILEDFTTANPTILRRVFPVRPPNWNTDLPCAFVGDRPESTSHDVQTRTRIISVSVTFVDRITDNTETMTRMDALVDLFADHLTGYPHITPNTIWNRWTTLDEQIDVSDGTGLQAVTFTVPDLSIQEGRV
jgi:hypothetical protein